MIDLIHLEKYYETPHGRIPALVDINLSIKPGEIFGIIGKSGAGKSSLIRCINLLEKPSAGTVKVADQSLTSLSTAQLRQARQHIGMIFQHFNLLSSQTVYDNVALPLKLQGMSASLIADTILPLLELVGLTDKKQHYPSQLSGGEKQRVAIARALVGKPKVLLCDEATSALDPQNTLAILDLLQNINEQLGVTILLITHEIDVIKTICHRVAVLEKGRIIKECPVLTFFSHRQDDPGMEFLKPYLKQDLPEVIQKRLLPESGGNTNPVLRLYFHGAMTSQPLIAHLIKELDLDLNILQATIEYIQHEPLGIMVVEVCSNHEHIAQGMRYLEQHGLTVEVIGHVARNAISID